jgi:chromosome transmission fidelity protein 1
VTISDSTRLELELHIDEDQFLPNDIEDEPDRVRDNLSPEVRALMAKYDFTLFAVLEAYSSTFTRLDKVRKPAWMESADATPEPTCTKIYYASRTHSQLSQVLHELEKLKINLSPASVVALHSNGRETQQRLSDVASAKRRISTHDEEDESFPPDIPTIDVRVVSLGSRKQLCINEKLRSKAGDLDEACRQLLSGELSIHNHSVTEEIDHLTEKGDRRCPHLPPMDDEVRMLDFRDQILVSLQQRRMRLFLRLFQGNAKGYRVVGGGRA